MSEAWRGAGMSRRELLEKGLALGEPGSSARPAAQDSSRMRMFFSDSVPSWSPWSAM
jgi:hypothetical protein